jgi:hypothetical protein
MVDMQFRHNWVDTPLFSNNAAANNVSVAENTLVVHKEGSNELVWPAAARDVMAGAGARWP